MQVKANDVVEMIDEHPASEMDLTTIRRMLVGREGTKCGTLCLLAFLAFLAPKKKYKSTDGDGSHHYPPHACWPRGHQMRYTQFACFSCFTGTKRKKYKSTDGDGSHTAIRRMLVGREGTKCGTLSLLAFLALLAQKKSTKVRMEMDLTAIRRMLVGREGTEMRSVFVLLYQ